MFLGRVGSPTFKPNFAPFHPLEFAVFFFFFKSQETQLRCFFDNSYKYSTFKMSWLKISGFNLKDPFLLRSTQFFLIFSQVLPPC